MEEYVSIHKIVSLIKQYQQSQVGIGLNSFGFGNIVEFGNTNNTGMTPTYPFVFVTPQNISYEENIVTYNMSLIFADRINDDLSNEVDVISDMDIQARRFMSFIKRGMNQNPDLYNKMDIVLPTNAVPFQERMNDFVGGVALDCNFVVFTDINACDYYEPEPSPTPSNTPEPTITPTPTLTPTTTCPTTTQYLEVILSDSDKFKLALYNDAGFTSPANALCDYVVSGTAFGSLGTIYTGTETILDEQHIHNFNLGPVLQPGEVVTGFTVYNVNTSTCVCPVIVDFSPYVPPTPTPTNTPTVTPTNTGTPTPTPTDGRACRTYELVTTDDVLFVTYTDCSGNPQTWSQPFGTTETKCAKQGSMVITSGSGTITDIGTC
jgi:hypothetical protein